MSGLFIIIAASGTGKTTLVSQLLVENSDMATVRSYTTRSRRKNEEATCYGFVTYDEFSQMIDNQDFLEYQKVFGNYYGTPIKEFESLRADGKNVILEIDWQGAMSVKEKMPSATCIAILPPSLEILSSRLSGRQTESIQDLNLRLKQAQSDIKAFLSIADYFVVNDNLNQACLQLSWIIRSEGLKSHNFLQENQKLLAGLQESD